MDFSNVEYPEEMMARVERDAAEAERKYRHQLQSIFPKAEALLTHGEYRRALLFFADKGALARYSVSLTDFLLCELHPELQPAYERYAAEETDQLKESVAEEKRRVYERTMLLTLGTVMALRRDRPDDLVPAVRWTTVLDLVRQITGLGPKRHAVTPQ